MSRSKLAFRTNKINQLQQVIQDQRVAHEEAIEAKFKVFYSDFGLFFVLEIYNSLASIYQSSNSYAKTVLLIISTLLLAKFLLSIDMHILKITTSC